MQTELILNQLQFLLRTLRDGQKGFAEAAERATDPQLTQFLTERSQQRGQFEEEIRQQIVKLGAEPFQHSSVSAALHRTWLNVRDALTGRDDYAVVSECERGEEVAVANYTDVLSEMELPAELRGLIQHQFAQVKASQTQLLDMKQAMKGQ